MAFSAWRPEVLAMANLAGLLAAAKVVAPRYIAARDGSGRSMRSEIALPAMTLSDGTVIPADPEYAGGTAMLLSSASVGGLARLLATPGPKDRDAVVFPADAAAVADADTPGERTSVQEIGVSVRAMERAGADDDSTAALQHRLNDLLERIDRERSHLGVIGVSAGFGAFAAAYSADLRIVTFQTSITVTAEPSA